MDSNTNLHVDVLCLYCPENVGLCVMSPRGTVKHLPSTERSRWLSYVVSVAWLYTSLPSSLSLKQLTIYCCESTHIFYTIIYRIPTCINPLPKLNNVLPSNSTSFDYNIFRRQKLLHVQ